MPCLNGPARCRGGRPRRASLTPALALLGLALYGLGAPLSAQPLPDASFEENVEVKVVNVDVLAFDGKGRPLQGLGVRDFEISEDGRPVQITNFYEETQVKWARSRPQIVVYVDDTYLSKADRDGVLGPLRRFVLERMAKEDARVMVAHSGLILDVLEGFTSEAASVEDAFDELADFEPTISPSRALERSIRNDMEDLLDLLNGSPHDRRLVRTALNGLLSSATGFAEIARRDTLHSAESLELLAKALGAQTGRKDLYLVTDGLALRPLAELVATLQQHLSQTPALQRSHFDSDASRGMSEGTAGTTIQGQAEIGARSSRR